MPLTATAVKQCKSKEKLYWLTDSSGLRLLVHTNGSKYWRLKYRYSGKQKTLALGVYPEVSLKEAREGRRAARKLLREGHDPIIVRRKMKDTQLREQDNDFGTNARTWWDNQRGTWTEDHAQRVWKRLKDNCRQIWTDDIDQLAPRDIISVVKKVESRGALDVANRILQDIRRICRYAVQTGKATANPATELQGVVKARKATHQSSLPREQLPKFLRSLDQYHDQGGRKLTVLAIKLLILTFVRPGELRASKWKEFDLDNKIWRIPGERMKMGTDHIVPLSKQAMDIVRQLREVSAQYELVFPSERRRTDPMSDNTMRKAIFRMGFDGKNEGKIKAVPHGFRATASSILNEEGYNPDAIERQLSHMERNGVRAAYTHHARYLDERRTMMNWWGDYLEKACKSKA